MSWRVACLVVGVLGAMAGCGDGGATLHLDVGASEGVTLAKVKALALVGLGSGATLSEQEWSMGGRDLASEPFVVDLEVQGDVGRQTAAVLLVGYDGEGVAQAAWAGTVDLGSAGGVTATLAALAPGCDGDADGFLACDEAACCDDGAARAFPDCDDANGAAHPYDPGSCAACPGGCDGAADDVEVVEPTGDATGEDATGGDADGAESADDASPCVDLCGPAGTRECTDDAHHRTCDDHDGDTCLEWGEPTACAANQACSGEGQCCECAVGACCDGCRYLPSSTKCAASASTEYTCEDGTGCGKDVYVRRQDGYCSGSSASCDGSLTWGDPVLFEECAGTEVCTPGSPTCAPSAACAATGAVFVTVPAGTYWMGSPNGEPCASLVGYPGGGCPDGGTATPEPGRADDETLHVVELTTPFEIQATEVTQGEWQATFAGWNPSYFAGCGDKCPVEWVNWLEAAAYANTRSIAEGLPPCYAFASVRCRIGGEPPDGTSYATCLDAAHGGIDAANVSLNGVATPYQCTGYRLPTEAEWEVAYRAGGVSAFYQSTGNDGTITQTGNDPLDPNLNQIAWFGGNATATFEGATDCSGWFGGATTCGPQPAGGKEANAWGVFDLAGNVLEWCWDGYEAYPAGTLESPARDPSGTPTPTTPVMRGGSWADGARDARAARRLYDAPVDRYGYLGLRLARSVAP